MTKGLEMEMLHPAVRQYRHNHRNAFVGAYDKEKTEEIVSGLVNELDRQKAISTILSETIERIIDRGIGEGDMRHFVGRREAAAIKGAVEDCMEIVDDVVCDHLWGHDGSCGVNTSIKNAIAEKYSLPKAGKRLR